MSLSLGLSHQQGNTKKSKIGYLTPFAMTKGTFTVLITFYRDLLFTFHFKWLANQVLSLSTRRWNEGVSLRCEPWSEAGDEDGFLRSRNGKRLSDLPLTFFPSLISQSPV